MHRVASIGSSFSIEGGDLYRSSTVRPIGAVLLALYGLAVLFVVAWPNPVDADSRGLIYRLLRALHRHGLPEFIGYAFVEFSANILMFVPLGFFIAVLLGPRWWWAAILICAALSVAIEVYQYFLLPDRFATVRDVIANSTGGLFGAGLALLPIAFLRSRDLTRPVVSGH